MKQPEYIEGPKATENFEDGMKALFKAPKLPNCSAEKEKREAGGATATEWRSDLENGTCRDILLRRPPRREARPPGRPVLYFQSLTPV